MQFSIKTVNNLFWINNFNVRFEEGLRKSVCSIREMSIIMDGPWIECRFYFTISVRNWTILNSYSFVLPPSFLMIHLYFFQVKHLYRYKEIQIRRKHRGGCKQTWDELRISRRNSLGQIWCLLLYRLICCKKSLCFMRLC